MNSLIKKTAVTLVSLMIALPAMAFSEKIVGCRCVNFHPTAGVKSYHLVQLVKISRDSGGSYINQQSLGPEFSYGSYTYKNINDRYFLGLQISVPQYDTDKGMYRTAQQALAACEKEKAYFNSIAMCR